jgi:hypothetical protein
MTEQVKVYLLDIGEGDDPIKTEMVTSHSLAAVTNKYPDAYVQEMTPRQLRRRLSSLRREQLMNKQRAREIKEQILVLDVVVGLAMRNHAQVK